MKNLEFYFNQNKDYASAQIIGQRNYQQDYFDFLVRKEVLFNKLAARALAGTSLACNNILAVMADGMGGEQAGEEASKIAVTTFVQSYTAYFWLPMQKRLAKALETANSNILKFRKANKIKKMGCTLVALAIFDNHAHWVSVGDSILWICKNNVLQRLNEDHSYGGVLDELVKRGQVSAEHAASSQNRNLLTSALTGDEIERIHYNEQPLKLQQEDYFIIATDGIKTLQEQEIAKIIYFNKIPTIIAKELIKRIEQKQKQRQDNTSIQILHFPHIIL